jgi:serine/threonine protein kinase
VCTYAAILCRKKIGSRWELKQIIGAGGAGVVVSAFDVRLREEVAIKVVLPDKSQRFSPKETTRLRREGQAMKRVQHASIVKLHEHFMDEKNEFCLFVMEIASGVSLHDVLRSGGTFTQARMIEIAKNLLGALNEIHRKNLIHLDIKPSNVMYKEDDGLWSVKIIDFSLARAPWTWTGLETELGDCITMMTTGGAIEGTTRFMPPEQLLKARRSISALISYLLSVLRSTSLPAASSPIVALQQPVSRISATRAGFVEKHAAFVASRAEPRHHSEFFALCRPGHCLRTRRALQRRRRYA